MPDQDRNYSLRTAWCEREVFLQKIAEEAYRAARYRLPFSVLVSKVSFYHQGTERDLRNFVGTGLRELHFVCKVAEDSYAFGMPNSPRAGAEIVAGRLRRVLIGSKPRTGVADVPESSVNASELLASAIKNLN